MTQTIPFVTICSVEDEDFYKRLFVVAPTDENPTDLGRATEYRLKRPQKNQHYSILKIYSGFQFPTNFEMSTNGGDPKSPPQPISAYEIARDLLEEWQGKGIHSSSLAKGLMIIQSEVPTAEELAKLQEMKWERMRTLVMKADQRIASGASLDTITPEDVRASQALGEPRAWSDPKKQMAKKHCMACAELILADATKCSHCGTDLESFYLEQHYTPDEIKEFDIAVWKNMEAKKKRLTRKPVVK
ncbi:MAG: hypothetical protein ACK5NY_01550 [Burkholderiaceae bacterium]|jgi:hypothetical protein